MYNPTFTIAPFSTEISEPAMEAHRIVAFLFLAAMLVIASVGNKVTAQSPSGEEDFSNSQNDCFPGMFYNRQYNAYFCVNTSLFGKGVMCQTNEAIVRHMPFCITSDWKISNQVVEGVCRYQPPQKAVILGQKLSTREEMNSLSCKALNWNETLCGKCANNYSLVINSYTIHCELSTMCKSQNIKAFLLSTFGPLTLFYCVIFLFQVNVAVSYMFTYVLFAQSVSLCVLQIQNGLLIVLQEVELAEILTSVFLSTIFGIWMYWHYSLLPFALMNM